MTVELIRSLLSYDPESGIVKWAKAPRCHSELLGKEAGAPIVNRRGKAYHVIKVGGKAHKRSRVAFVLMLGKFPDNCVDHINGQSLDDRWLNLREATVTENTWNHKTRAKPSPLPMGVRLEANGRYRARIAVNKRAMTVGTFDTAEAASVAYQKAREAHFGQYA